MKLNGDFVVRQVADEVIVLPVGETALKLNGMIMLNGVSLIIWRCLEQETDVPTIVTAVTEQFDVSAKQAEADVLEFLEQLRGAKLLSE